MSDTFWTGEDSYKLYLTSGQFSDVIKDSLSVDEAPHGISYDGTDTVWVNGPEGRLILQSGAFDALVKDSLDVSSVDNLLYGCCWDGWDIHLAGSQKDKLYLLSGQFTTTIKSSLDTDLVYGSSDPRGVSFNGTQTVWLDGATQKLYLQEGFFTTVVDNSYDVNSIDTNPQGVDWDGTNSPWTGGEAWKLYLQSGQFTSTLQKSWTSGVDVPLGISDSTVSAREWKTEVDAQCTATVVCSGVAFQTSDTFWCGDANDKLYLTSGQFTDILKDSQDLVKSPAGVSYDGTDTIWCNYGWNKLFLQSGAFDSVVKISYTLSGVDAYLYNCCWDGMDVHVYGDKSRKLYLLSGQFTSIVKNSLVVFDVSSDTYGRGGVTLNGAQTAWGSFDSDKLYLQVGLFTTALDNSLSVNAIDNHLYGVDWDGTNSPWMGHTNDKLYLQSGQFTSTLQKSQYVGGVDTLPRGISDSTASARLISPKVDSQCTATVTCSTVVSYKGSSDLSCIAITVPTATFLVEGSSDLTCQATVDIVSVKVGIVIVLGAAVEVVCIAEMDYVVSVDLSGEATVVPGYIIKVDGSASLVCSATVSTTGLRLDIAVATLVGVASSEIISEMDYVATATLTSYAAVYGYGYPYQPLTPGPPINWDDPDEVEVIIDEEVIEDFWVGNRFHMDQLDIGYTGKSLSFTEILTPFTETETPGEYDCVGLVGTYKNEEDFQLRIDFGDGLKTYFRGKIKNQNVQARNQANQITYIVAGYSRVADEVLIRDADGYPGMKFSIMSTVTTATSYYLSGAYPYGTMTTVVDVVEQVMPTVGYAVGQVFEHNAAYLTAEGIPATIGTPGTDLLTALLPEEVDLRNIGFSSALSELVSYSPGRVAFFDDETEAWIFPNVLEAPVRELTVNTFSLLEAVYDLDTTDRYTAIELYPDFNRLGTKTGVGFWWRSGRRPIVIKLKPAWDIKGEESWTAAGAEAIWDMYGIYGIYDLYPPGYWAYRRYAIPGRLGFHWQGGKYVYFGDVPPPSMQEGTRPIVWMKVITARGRAPIIPDQFYWWPIEANVNLSDRIVELAYPAIAGGNVLIPGDAEASEEVVLTYLPQKFGMFTGTYTPSMDVEPVRWPPIGYAGTAYTVFDIKRERVEYVDYTEVTTINAERRLSIWKDIKIAGSLPISGSPLPDLLHLQRRLVLKHLAASSEEEEEVIGIPTGLEDIPAILDSCTYKFGQRGVHTLNLSTDTSNYERIR